MRHGAYIAPKLMFGYPIDMVVMFARTFIPAAILQPVLRLVLRLAIGQWEDYGLQRPTCGPLEMHPTLNGNILEALRSGKVLPRVGIDHFDGAFVQFRDERREPFDTIIWATGFRNSFAFLPSTIVDWPGARTPPLYLKMMHGVVQNLYFIGLFQPVGCIWNVADIQARIAAQQIIGRLQRPNDIAVRIQREMSNPHWRYAKSPRHAIEVDVRYFRRELLRELARGQV
jgi:Flavin-binding monooxygenase-like